MIDKARVYSVYSGVVGGCTCGCSGNWRYASKFRDYASNDRGYPVGDDEVSDHSVSIIVGKMNKAERFKDVSACDTPFRPEPDVLYYLGNGCYTMDTLTRTYIANVVEYEDSL